MAIGRMPYSFNIVTDVLFAHEALAYSNIFKTLWLRGHCATGKRKLVLGE